MPTLAGPVRFLHGGKVSLAVETPDDVFTGNGVATTFPISFTFEEAFEVLVYFDGELIESGYTPEEGQVTFATAPASGVKIRILRETALDQPRPFEDPQKASLEELGRMSDRIVRQLQEARSSLRDTAARSFLVPFGEDLDMLPSKATRAGLYTAFDDDGKLVVRTASAILAASGGAPDGVGLPPGGRPGQQLAKLSGADADASWITGRVLSIAEFGASVDGSDDSEAVTDTIAAANPGDTILIPGDTKFSDITINKSLVIVGDGHKVEWDTAGEKVFKLEGDNLKTRFLDIRFEYTGAWANSRNEAIVGVSGDGGTIVLRDCTFKDCTSGLYTNNLDPDLLISDGCEFLYTHGRASAGIGNVDYSHPCVGILGGAKTTILRGNRFNGLVDSTFTGVDAGSPASQRTPADGFFKTGGYSPTVVEIVGNIVSNHAIEGIIVERTPQGAGKCLVQGNMCFGSSVKSAFYSTTMPAIFVAGFYDTSVLGNYVNGALSGIVVDDASTPADCHLSIIGNATVNVLAGIVARTGSDKSVILSNHIHCRSDFAAGITGGAEDDLTPCQLVGIYGNRGWAISNTIIHDEPGWTSEHTLSSRASNVFTLDDATGIEVGGLLVSYADDKVAMFPVTGVSGADVTVGLDSANNQTWVTSGTLYYEAQPSGSYPYRGGFVNSSGSGSDILKTANNTIVGALNDFTGQNSGVIWDLGNILQGVRYINPAGSRLIRFGPALHDGVFHTRGTTATDDAPAGSLGEYIESTVASGSAVGLTTAIGANITSIGLTAGDWDIDFDAYYTLTGATLTQLEASVSLTTAAIDTTPGRLAISRESDTTLSATRHQPKGATRLSIDEDTTVYLTTRGTFSAGTLAAYGVIRARRIR